MHHGLSVVCDSSLVSHPNVVLNLALLYTLII